MNKETTGEMAQKFLKQYPKELPISSRQEIPKNRRVEAKNKERGIEIEANKKKAKKGRKKDFIKKIYNLIPQSKKFILERDKATIVLKDKELEPTRSLFFNEEFRKERDKEIKYFSEYNL